ncbi:MAG: GNAT family N-acetyltransferase [Candidatus Aminicenantes bacterium]|nr:GNAT family N-acetyltransferase [Candidatus Aminicenantes bacterium]
MVRPMKPEDREIVLDIIRATKMFTPAEISVARELIDIYLDQPEQRDYFLDVVEKEPGAVVGYMAYGPTPLTDGTYDLYWMAVAPDQQGSGFGKELVNWLEKKVAERGGRMVLIETSSQPRYEPTRRFYTFLGYQEISRIPDFYRDGDDRITYIKQIA